MTIFRISLRFARVSRAIVPITLTCVSNKNINNNEIMQNQLIQFQSSYRCYSQLEISKSMEIISNDKINSKVNNLKLENAQEKPLVVLLTWLMARRKHVMKYANFYLEQGFDVLNVSCNPWQVLWPTKGIQLVAADFLKFLERNPSYKPVMLHGFSVGGYLWGEVLVKAVQDEKRYQPLLDRIIGQVWDSSVDVTEIQIGVPKAVFPNNLVLQKALNQYIMYHLKTFDKVATTHYIRASQMYHTNLLRSPALIFVSKKDPIGTVSANKRARESWESMGTKVYWKCFDKSPHVGHYRTYPKEYVAELYNFIDSLGLVQYPKKIQQRI